MGLSTGEHIMHATLPPKANAIVTKSQEEHVRSHMAKRRTELALQLFSYAFGWWVATLAVRLFGLEVSRRVVSNHQIREMELINRQISHTYSGWLHTTPLSSLAI